jgi:uncharacterized protein YegP (UPF0339 family)
VEHLNDGFAVIRVTRGERIESGLPGFVLLAANKEAIRKSEMHSSTSAMENGIRSGKKNGPTAKVDDQT